MAIGVKSTQKRISFLSQLSYQMCAVTLSGTKLNFHYIVRGLLRLLWHSSFGFNLQNIKMDDRIIQVLRVD